MSSSRSYSREEQRDDRRGRVLRLAGAEADSRLEPRRRHRAGDVHAEVDPDTVEGVLEGGGDRGLPRARRAVQNDDLPRRRRGLAHGSPAPSPGSLTPAARARATVSDPVSGATTTRNAPYPSTTQRLHERLEPERERERLVGLLAAERDEVVRGGAAREDVAVGDASHGHVRDDGLALGVRDPDRERRRPDERRPAAGRRQPRRRGGGQQREQTGLREPPHPVAERPGREAVARDDDPRRPRRALLQRPADRGEGEVAERAAPVPAARSRGLRDPLGPRRRVEVGAASRATRRG